MGVAGAALAASRVKGANDRINVAQIGIGARGSYHLDACLRRQQARGDVQVVAVCDTYRKRLSKAAEKAGGVKAYLHHQEMLTRSDIDAVFIATPDHWHAPIALAAMAAGKDVYVEKPMTHTLAEARELRDRTRDLRRIVQVGVQGTSWTRWHKVRDIVESGMIGHVVAAQGTYSRNNPDGDWNWDIDPEAGPHGKGDNYIDWQQWLGAAPARAFDADRFFRFGRHRHGSALSHRGPLASGAGESASHARGGHGRTVGLQRRPRGAGYFYEFGGLSGKVPHHGGVIPGERGRAGNHAARYQGDAADG
jgi:predicted dehydrogenase